MGVRIGINGFGRIGRQFLKAVLERHPELEVVAVNDLADPQMNAYLFKHDTNYGNYKGDVSATADALVIDGRSIKVLAEKDPAKLPWKDLGVDVVIDMDLTANAKLLPAVLRPKGSVIIYGTGPEATIPAAFCLVNSIRLQFFLVYELDATERERAIATIDSALKQGVLLNRVAQPTFRLDDIAAAHEAVERGSLGNVLMRP